MPRKEVLSATKSKPPGSSVGQVSKKDLESGCTGLRRARRDQTSARRTRRPAHRHNQYESNAANTGGENAYPDHAWSSVYQCAELCTQGLASAGIYLAPRRR